MFSRSCRRVRRDSRIPPSWFLRRRIERPHQRTAGGRQHHRELTCRGDRRGPNANDSCTVVVRPCKPSCESTSTARRFGLNVGPKAFVASGAQRRDLGEVACVVYLQTESVQPVRGMRLHFVCWLNFVCWLLSWFPLVIKSSSMLSCASSLS